MSAGPDGVEVAASLLARLRELGLTLGSAESLTGGLLAATVVSVPGASDVFRGAVVAYDAAVKVEVLGVDAALVDRVGTVDEGVALAMATGARTVLGCDVAVATTGVAGPGPSEGKPAGTVYVACVAPWGRTVAELALTGDRAQIRAAAVRAALDLAVSAGRSGAAGTVGRTDESPAVTATTREEGTR